MGPSPSRREARPGGSGLRRRAWGRARLGHRHSNPRAPCPSSRSQDGGPSRRAAGGPAATGATVTQAARTRLAHTQGHRLGTRPPGELQMRMPPAPRIGGRMGRAPRVPATAGWPPEGVPAAHTPRQQKPMRTTRLHLRKPWGVSRHRHSGRQAGTDPVKLSAQGQASRPPSTRSSETGAPGGHNGGGHSGGAPSVGQQVSGSVVTRRAEGRSDKGWTRAVRGPQAAPPRLNAECKPAGSGPVHRSRKGAGRPPKSLPVGV